MENKIKKKHVKSYKYHNQGEFINKLFNYYYRICLNNMIIIMIIIVY